MQTQDKTMQAIELLAKLGATAAEVFAIGVEEDDDEIVAFKDVIGIAGRAMELTAETIDEALANMNALIEAIRNTEPGKEEELITIEGKWAKARDDEVKEQMVWGLTTAAEQVTLPDERRCIDGMINYLKDFWDSPV